MDLAPEQTGRKGSKNPKKFAIVIYGCHVKTNDFQRQCVHIRILFPSLSPDLCFASPLEDVEEHDDLLPELGAHPAVDHAVRTAIKD